MDKNNFRIYRIITISLISIFTFVIIVLGIAISTNKEIQDIFFKPRFINNKIITNLINNGKTVEYQYFYLLGFLLFFIFVIGGVYFNIKKQFEIENGINKEHHSLSKKSKRIIRIICILVFAIFVFLIEEFARRGPGGWVSIWLVFIFLMLFILTLLLSLI